MEKSKRVRKTDKLQKKPLIKNAFGTLRQDLSCDLFFYLCHCCAMLMSLRLLLSNAPSHDFVLVCTRLSGHISALEFVFWFQLRVSSPCHAGSGNSNLFLEPFPLQQQRWQGEARQISESRGRRVPSWSFGCIIIPLASLVSMPVLKIHLLRCSTRMDKFQARISVGGGVLRDVPALEAWHWQG